MIVLLCALAFGQDDGKPDDLVELPAGSEILIGPDDLPDIGHRSAPDGRLVLLIDPTDIGLGVGALLSLLAGAGAARRYGPAMPSRDVALTSEVVTLNSDVTGRLDSMQTAIGALAANMAMVQQQSEHTALTVANSLDVAALALEQGRHLIEIIPRAMESKK